MAEETSLNSDNKSITASLFWKFSERILAQMISFIVSIILARILLPSDYGIVSLVMVFIVFADVFVTSGFSTSLIQKKDADATDFSTIFYCSLVVSVLIYLLLFLLAPSLAVFFNAPDLCPVLRVFSLRIPLSAYNSIQHAYVSRHMMFRKFFFSTLFGTLFSGVVGIIAAYMGLGVWALVIQYLTNTIIDSIWLSFTVHWYPQLLFSLHSAKKLMGYGWKVLAADFSGVFFDQLRSLLIGRFYTSEDLAYYNRGKSFSGLVMDNISTTVMAVLFPALSNENDNLLKVKQMIRKAVSMMAYIIFPLIGGLVVVSRPLVYCLLTNKWNDSIPYLQILSIAAGIGMIGNVSLQAIKAVGRSDVLLKLEFIKKPIYILLLVAGIYYGPLYVAVTMMVYSFYSTFVNAFPLRRIVHYSTKEQLLDLTQPLFMTIAMCIVIYFLKLIINNQLLLLIIQIVAGMLIYLILSIVFKVASFYDLKERIIPILKH